MVWELKQLAAAGHIGQLEPVMQWWYYFNCVGLS